MSDIRTWLEGLGLGEHAEAFEAENITPALIGDLDDGDLKELGLSMGHRKLVRRAVTEPAPAPAAPPREAERRQITVMFCDLVGSTALSEKLDPEDLRALMQGYQKAAGEVIERFGGHVAQYLGDGLMTYFGWPSAHEDDAERAARASLDIVEAVGAMDLAVRIGIATGPVVVGETGAGDASVPKLAVGETPNLAARLQGLAGPDEIVVGPSTRRLLGGTFELADMGEQALKGIVEPVHAHRVTGIAATEGRFEAQHQHLTPLVGREAEMAMVMARWEQAKGGEGQVIVLGGEPGIGKSRITQALRERVADEPHTRLRYQCSPYHTNSALHPVIEQLERAAGFAREDTPDQKLDKLEPLIPGALVAALLSLPIERYPALAMSPQKQKEETLRVLAEQVTALAAVEPVLLIFEDAHWIDPTSQELLDLVVPAVSGHRVLAVITHRPEYTPPWTGQGHVAPLALTRLGRADAAAMVARVSDKPLSEDMLDQIVAKTDGVPLFVEELTKTVIETGAETASTIPETLQDSLMARLDRLAPVREIAQIGACIGREFSHELLAAVSPLGDNDLGEALQQLINSELIYRAGNGYVFKHALVQDAAYESLLKSRRQHLHSDIAQALPRLMPTVAETEPELLARHYTSAGRIEEALPHWLSAGQLAFARARNAEAIRHFDNGLALLDQQSERSDSDGLAFSLNAGLAFACIAEGGYGDPRVAEALAAAEKAAEGMAETPALVGARCMFGVYHWARGDLVAAGKYLDGRADKAPPSADTLLQVAKDWSGGVYQLHAGRLAFGKQILDRAMSVYDSKAHAPLVVLCGMDPGAGSLAWLTNLNSHLGYLDTAMAEAREGIDLAERASHPLTLALALCLASIAAATCRSTESTIDWSDACIALCAEQRIPFWAGWSRAVHGYVVAITEDIDQGLAEFRAADRELVAIGCHNHVPWSGWLEADALVSRGRYEDAVQVTDACAEEARRQSQPGWFSPLATTKGTALQLAGHVDAEMELSRAIALAREYEQRTFELRAATSLARLRQSQGKAAEAHDLLAPVYDWFTEGFDTADLLDAKALLHELTTA